MNTIQSQSYSLLSQEEIDVLVDFLNAKKGSVNSDVMSQKSIDKLIYLITSDKQQIIKDLCNPLNDVNSSLLETMHFRENFEEICTLSCTTDPQTGFLKLTATNTKNGNENDSEEWGVCISPLMFNHLARVLSLVYTTETHERICSIFAKENYNDENYPIPAFYMPTNVNLLEMLID